MRDLEWCVDCDDCSDLKLCWFWFDLWSHYRLIEKSWIMAIPELHVESYRLRCWLWWLVRGKLVKVGGWKKGEIVIFGFGGLGASRLACSARSRCARPCSARWWRFAPSARALRALGGGGASRLMVRFAHDRRCAPFVLRRFAPDTLRTVDLHSFGSILQGLSSGILHISLSQSGASGHSAQN